MEDTAHDWRRYVADLIALAGDPGEQQRRGFDEFTRTWAIGTAGWKQAVARAYSHRAIDQDLPHVETCALKEERWKAVLKDELRRHRKDVQDLAHAPKGVRWKVEIALTLRKRAAAPYSWISKALAMGSPHSARVAVWKLVNG